MARGSGLASRWALLTKRLKTLLFLPPSLWSRRRVKGSELTVARVPALTLLQASTSRVWLTLLQNYKLAEEHQGKPKPASRPLISSEAAEEENPVTCWSIYAKKLKRHRVPAPTWSLERPTYTRPVAKIPARYGLYAWKHESGRSFQHGCTARTVHRATQDATAAFPQPVAAC